MKPTLATASLAALLFAAPASAEIVDVATVKCSDLVSMNDSDGTFLFTWLLGYAGGQAGDTTIDLSEMDALGTAIGEYCGANPDVGVISAAAAVAAE